MSVSEGRREGRGGREGVPEDAVIKRSLVYNSDEDKVVIPKHVSGSMFQKPHSSALIVQHLLSLQAFRRCFFFSPGRGLSSNNIRTQG